MIDDASTSMDIKSRITSSMISNDDTSIIRDILTCCYKLLGFHILFHHHNQLWSLSNFCSRENFDIRVRESLYRGFDLFSQYIIPMIFQIYFFQRQSWSLWNPEKVNWNKLSKKGNKFQNWTNSLTCHCMFKTFSLDPPIVWE